MNNPEKLHQRDNVSTYLNWQQSWFELLYAWCRYAIISKPFESYVNCSNRNNHEKLQWIRNEMCLYLDNSYEWLELLYAWCSYTEALKQEIKKTFWKLFNFIFTSSGITDLDLQWRYDFLPWGIPNASGSENYFLFHQTRVHPHGPLSWDDNTKPIANNYK